MGVWFGITGTGNLCVFLLTSVIGTTIVSKDGSMVIPDDHKWFHLTAAGQFYFYAGLMLVGTVAFVLIANVLMKDAAQTEPVSEQ